jgi:hypothetical protein
VLLPLAAALAVVSGQTHIDLVGQLRLGTNLRSPFLGDKPGAAVVVDVDATPSLAAALEHGGGRILLGYAPTFRVREPYDLQYARPEMYQYQYLQAFWQREGRPRPYFTEAFSYGTVDWATLFTQNEVAGSPFPGAMLPGAAAPGAAPSGGSGGLLSSPALNGTFNQFYFDATGGVSWPLGRLHTLDTSAGVTYGGGSDAASKVVLPTETLGRGRVQLDSKLDAIDTLIARSELVYVEFSRAPTTLSVYTEIDASGRFRRQLTPVITGEAAIGLSTVRAWPGGQPRPAWGVAPIAQGVGSVHAASGPHAVIFDAVVGVAPFIDRFSAQVYERFDSAGTLLYIYRNVWQAGLRGGFGQSLQTANNVTTGIIEGRLGYVPPRIWRIDLTATNSAAVYGTALVNTWYVALSVTLRAEGMY